MRCRKDRTARGSSWIAFRSGGVSKAAARIDEWRKDLAPSNVLRKWIEHDPSKWKEFQSRYLNEPESTGKVDELRIMGEKARREILPLVYAAMDELRNDAMDVKAVIETLSG